MKAQDISNPLQGFDALDEAGAKADRVQFRVLLKSIETLRKIYNEIEKLWDYIDELLKKIKDLQDEVARLAAELDALRNQEWALGERHLKPAVVRQVASV